MDELEIEVFVSRSSAFKLPLPYALPYKRRIYVFGACQNYIGCAKSFVAQWHCLVFYEENQGSNPSLPLVITFELSKRTILAACV